VWCLRVVRAVGVVTDIFSSSGPVCFPFIQQLIKRLTKVKPSRVLLYEAAQQQKTQVWLDFGEHAIEPGQ
jgi:hypothetical protein